MKSFILNALTVFTTILASTLPTIVTAQSTPENSAGTVQISCGSANDPSSRKVLPATVATVSGNSESIALIIWKSEYFGTKYTPQQRCSIVSSAIQKSFVEGRTYIGAGIDKQTGLGVICGVANPDQQCDRTNILLTLKSYQNAEDTLDRLGQVMSGKTGQPVYQSSGGKRVNLRDLLRRK
jgi:Circadian oscillating protein COP23